MVTCACARLWRWSFRHSAGRPPAAAKVAVCGTGAMLLQTTYARCKLHFPGRLLATGAAFSPSFIPKGSGCTSSQLGHVWLWHFFLPPASCDSLDLCTLLASYRILSACAGLSRSHTPSPNQSEPRRDDGRPTAWPVRPPPRVLATSPGTEIGQSDEP